MGPRESRRKLVVLGTAALVCAALPAGAQSTGPVEISLQPVVSGLALPVGITHAGDASGRLFIIQQTGQVRIFNDTQLLPTAFLDISTLVSCCGERGLLSVAFHPQYTVNGFFFVNYTDTTGATVVARYRVSADPNLADPASGEVIVRVPQPFANHNGGQLQFGPDGFLYIGMGDGGSAGDPDDRAQNLQDLLGKLLRLDVDSATPYAIPLTNPFRGRTDAREEIWALGLRNPWRFTFDRQTGDLFIADVGQSRREEVNFQSAGSPGGENYGWRRMEGSLCFNPSTNCNDGALVLPVLEYDHASGDCSIIGGYRYRGALFPQLTGVYFFADLCTGRLWGALPDPGGAWSAQELQDASFQVTTFGEDEAGELYLSDYSGGRVLRLVVSSTAAPQLAQLVPASIEAATPGLTLRLQGADFTPGSVAQWNGSARVTTFLTESELEAALLESDLAAPGTAMVVVSTPPPGGGDSQALTFTITDFAVTAAPGSVTVRAGQSATYTVTVAAQLGPFNRSVGLGCGNLPARVSCSFSSSNPVPGNTSAQAQLTLSTAAAGSQASYWNSPGTEQVANGWVLLLAVAMMTLAVLRSRRRALALPVVLLLALQAGCGGGSSSSSALSPGTPPGTYMITISGTSGALQHTTTVQLVVQ